jgi:hypothetical protein
MYTNIGKLLGIEDGTVVLCMWRADDLAAREKKGGFHQMHTHIKQLFGDSKIFECRLSQANLPFPVKCQYENTFKVNFRSHEQNGTRLLD